MAPGPALPVVGVARALIPLFCILAAWIALASVLASPHVETFVTSVAADAAFLHASSHRADARPEEFPCAISRKHNKRQRSAKRKPPPAEHDIPFGAGAIAVSFDPSELPPRHHHFAAVVDRSTLPARGLRLLPRAPPGLTVG